MRIFLARHGETTWNAEHRLQGRADTPLTPRGQEHGRELAAFLRHQPLHAIYSSSLQRAVHTATATAAAHGLVVVPRPDLVEIGYGVLEGHTAQDPDPEIRRLWAERKRDPLRFRAPGGESYAELWQRVGSFVDEIRRQHAGDCLLIVGHRATNRALYGHLLGLGPEGSLQLKQKHDCLLEIDTGGEPACIVHRYAPVAEPRSQT